MVTLLIIGLNNTVTEQHLKQFIQIKTCKLDLKESIVKKIF